jgi:glycosyltransferase involved in cell wall biosynthesis
VSGRPLVTLALPVRNGGRMLRGALDSMVAQDYPNIEILVSDNASDDETPSVLSEYAARHPSIRLIRQQRPLPAMDNFLFLLGQARGEFFAWCAHDDTRTPDFVSALVGAFDDPHAVLAFGDLHVWDGTHPPHRRADYAFATDGLPDWRRVRKTALLQCYHLYGLWRTAVLRDVQRCYAPTHWWPDLPIMLAAAAHGVFRHVPGPQFRYFEVLKSDSERAAYQDYRQRVSKARAVAALLRSVFVTVARSRGPGLALAAALFTAEKFVRKAPGYVGRRIFRSNRLRRPVDA